MIIKTHQSILKILSEINLDIELSTTNELTSAIGIIVDVCSFTADAVVSLKALYNSSPLLDGDIPSKAGLYKLIENGYASKIIVKGQDGYNACTYKGAIAYKVVKCINAEVAGDICLYFNGYNKTSRDDKILKLLNEIKIINQFYKMINDKVVKGYKIVTCEKGHTTLRSPDSLEICDICVFESVRNSYST